MTHTNNTKSPHFNCVVFSSGIKKLPLGCFLSVEEAQSWMVLGWGNKANTAKPRAFAQQHGLAYWSLEDGFLRSEGLGAEGYAPLSLVVDDLGIYYDASQPSRLEKMIQDKAALNPKLADGQRAWDLIVEHRLTKYNHAPDVLPSHLCFEQDRQHILVIDQTAGDMALKYGGATAASFEEMFIAACKEHPQAVIWVKIHPDVLLGKKQGHLKNVLQDARVRVISEDINPLLLISQMQQVYTVTSQMGFEALLLGKKVVTFGLPWYAAWGVTDDRHANGVLLQQQRRGGATVLELFTAAYLQYCRYLNPFTRQAGDIFDVIRYLALVKRKTEYLQGTIICIGFSWWKRKIIAPFLQTRTNQLQFLPSLAQCQRSLWPNNARLLLWGKKDSQSEQWAKQQGMAVLRMEDGFIRSVGLGSNLVAPLSLVIDDMGIYFDATTPSRLEWLLQNHQFTASELTQAKALAEELINNQIGKYNVGQGGLTVPVPRPKQVILIPGQVEDDASIAFGAAAINTNLALIQQVRRHHPDAYLIYKPHPDVVSGNRTGKVGSDDALRYVDAVVTQADILMCIADADEVHTMTSLAGFEALLRGKKVVCYGAPFYSGWGLTEDKYPIKRRNRLLSVEELLAATMLLYPVYLNPKTGRDIDALTALHILAEQKQHKLHAIHSGYLLRKYNQLAAIMRVLIHRKIK